MQELEEKRAVLVKNSLEKFVSIRQSTHPMLRELLDHITTVIEEITDNEDVKRFVQKRKKSYTGDFFFQAEDGLRALTVTGVQTCALPI